LTGQESAFIENMPKLQQMTAAVNRGDGAAALAVFRTMPQEMQNQKMVLALRLRAAQSVSDAEYLQAMDELRRNFGHDPAIHLILIDSYALRGEHERVLETVDALDKAVGGDPYLNVMRASTYLMKNDLATARQASDRAIAEAPDLVDPHIVGLTIALTDRRFDDVLKLLQVLNEKFGLDLGNLDEAPLYQEFVKSPQYQTWLEGHPAAANPAGEAGTPAVP
jgi:hypothetical protein